MRKKILTLALLLILTLCSCEKRTFGTVEISASTLTGLILDEDDLDIIVAVYNDEDPNYKDFLNTLDKIAKDTNRNIYIVDGEHIDYTSSMILYDGLQIEYEKLIYFVYQDGIEEIYNYYSDYNTILENLANYESIYKIDVDKYDTLNKDEYIDLAREAFDKGQISSSFEYLNMIWPSQAAKEEFNSKNLYQIVKRWETFISKDKENAYYYSFIFSSGQDILYYASQEGKLNEIGNIGLADYEIYYYYIKDNDIYISEKSDGKYQKAYTILSLKDDSLTIKDNKTTYNLYPDL